MIYEKRNAQVFKGDAEKKHSQYLLEAVYNLLQKNQFLSRKKKLDAIVCSSGPGSFTSLRAAASITKALSFSFNIPIIAVGSLPAIAQTIADKLTKEKRKVQQITVLMDARVRGIYACSYKIVNQKIIELHSAQLIDLENLNDFLSSMSPKENLLCGNCFKVYGQETQSLIENLGWNTDDDILFLDSPNLKAMLKLALLTPKDKWHSAKSFNLNYIRNKVTD